MRDPVRRYRERGARYPRADQASRADPDHGRRGDHYDAADDANESSLNGNRQFVR